MAYDVVLKENQSFAHFEVTGEEVLIIKVGTSTVELWLDYPDNSGRHELLRTYTENANQRLRTPANTLMYVSASNSDAMVWKGSVPLDTAGVLL